MEDVDGGGKERPWGSQPCLPSTSVSRGQDWEEAARGSGPTGGAVLGDHAALRGRGTRPGLREAGGRAAPGAGRWELRPRQAVARRARHLITAVTPVVVGSELGLPPRPPQLGPVEADGQADPALRTG